MKCIYTNDKGEFEIYAGVRIQDACEELVLLATKLDSTITIPFNDIPLIVSPKSNANEIIAGFYTEMNRRREEYERSPAGIKAKEEAEHFRAIAAKAASEGILPFSVVNESEWKDWCDKNQDGYGSCVMRYAARWANYMEKELAQGKPLAEIADTCSHEADLEGITGFMYGCAVSTLAKVWIHGEELRRWHNKAHQLKDEGDKANENGGVLNPACLTIGV